MKSNVNKFLTAMVLATLLSSIASGFESSGEKPAKSAETRVYLRRQCIVSEANVGEEKEFAGLGAVFLPLLLKNAIGGIGAALKKAGASQELKDSGLVPTYLFKLNGRSEVKAGKETLTQKLKRNQNLGCVIVVRGSFYDSDPKDQSLVNFENPSQRELIGPDETAARIARLKLSNIPVKEIAMLFEAKLQFSEDGTAMFYENRFLEVRSFQGTRSSDNRGLVIGLTLSAPGAKEGDGEISSALINLGNVRKNSVYGPNELSARKSRWFGGVGISSDALKLLETLTAANGQSIGVMPATFEATIVETEDGNKALVFIGTLLEGAKDDASKAVSDAVLKDYGKEKSDALETSRADEEKAYGEFLTSLVNLAAEGVPFPVPSPKSNAYTPVQLVSIAGADAKFRTWCNKLNAVTALGLGSSRVNSERCGQRAGIYTSVD